MDDYLEILLARQKVVADAEQSSLVLKKLNEEINASAGNAVESFPAVRMRGEVSMAAKHASERKREAALTKMAAQLTEALQAGSMDRRTVFGMEETEESSGWRQYGFIPVAQQETLRERTHLSMDGISRFFERDARRYPG